MPNALVILLIALACCGLASAQHVPSEQAQQLGLRTCQSAVDVFSTKNIGDKNHASTAIWNKQAANDRLFSAAVVVKYKDGASLMALTAAPTRNGQCDSSYTFVYPLNFSCAETRRTMLGGWTIATELEGLITLKGTSGVGSATMFPMGSGCVLVITGADYQ